MAFQYPDHPNTGRTDPFVGPDGKNPFADSDAPSEPAPENPQALPVADTAHGASGLRSSPAPDNPYAWPEGDAAVSYRPVYEVSLPHRGRTVFGLGASASVSAGLAVASAGAMWAIPNFATNLLGAFCPVLIIATLTLGGTGWMLGRHDLQAIRGGAMDPAGLKLTRRGHRLGVIGVSIAVGVIAIFIASAAVR